MIALGLRKGELMKSSYYDILQVSPKASAAVINAAHANLREALVRATQSGDQEARNQLLFLDEAFGVLSSPVKREAYDANLLQVNAAPSLPLQNSSGQLYSESTFMNWWGDSTTLKVLLAVGAFAAVFSAYKFIGQSGEQGVKAKQVEVLQVRELGAVQNDNYRAETERAIGQGALQNEKNLIDKSYDIASREAERRRTELEYKANAGSQMLEMQRQRHEAQLKEQKWRQEQYEKELKLREAREAADAPKRQLCNMYALNGKYREARAAGCY